MRPPYAAVNPPSTIENLLCPDFLNIVGTCFTVSLRAVSPDLPLTWGHFEQGFASLDSNRRTRNLLPGFAFFRETNPACVSSLYVGNIVFLKTLV